MELNKFSKLLNTSTLDDLDKKLLNNALKKIKNKYNLFEEKISFFKCIRAKCESDRYASEAVSRKRSIK